MRKIWVNIDPWDKKLVTTALEGGANGIMVPKGYTEKVKELGKVPTISEDGDLVLGKDVVFYKIKSGEDEKEIVDINRTKQVILQCEDWTIIPLENLIAKGVDVIAQVHNLVEAQTAFGILEKGVNHIRIIPYEVTEDIKAALPGELNWEREIGVVYNVGPEEIAVSILAKLIAVKNG